MVNITNDEIKLLKKMLDEYGKSIASVKTYLNRKEYFKYQNLIVELEHRVKRKKELNREQYEDRLFWKEYERKKEMIT